MLVRPKEPFVVDEHGNVIGTSHILDDSDPLVRARPDMFEPVAVNYSSRPVVETTRAEPGEPRRGPGRPRKIQ